MQHSKNKGGPKRKSNWDNGYNETDIVYRIGKCLWSSSRLIAIKWKEKKHQESKARQEPTSKSCYNGSYPLNATRIWQTQYGERFLFFDSGVGNENHLILFGAEHAIGYLRDFWHWFADGTFKVCPNLFFQVYTVHALDNGRSFPCIYGLLPNKTEEIYNRLWQEVGNVVQHNPDDIMTDFEI